MKKTIQLLILLVLFPITFATANVANLFEEFYYSDAISSRHCGQNINNFIKYLAQKGHYHPDIKVLYYDAPGNPWGFSQIVALNARWGKEIAGSFHSNWVFHVVTVLHGKVYDFSFNDTPRVLPIKRYFEEMLVPKRPVAIYGPDFRVRGQGPYYTPERAIEEVKRHQFRIIHTEPNGRETRLVDKLDYRQMLNYFGIR
jgi:hypothetical protein